jgi:hypothetical protein
MSSTPVRITILVGTMTGTAQLVAQELELAWDDGETKVETLMMDALDSSVFERPGVFLICTSTYGQGDVPDNAKALYADLQAKRPNLSQVRYGRIRARRPHVCGDFQFRRQALRRHPRRARRATDRRSRAARCIVRRAPRGNRAGVGRRLAYACARGLRASRVGGEQTMNLSTADHSVAPPRIDVPRDYNAAHDLIERNLAADRGAKIAYIDDAGETTYAQLAERVDRFASGLTALGLDMEHRVMIAMLDTIDWPVAFSRRNQGRHRAGRGEHAAHDERIRVHALGQPGARARRV